MRKVLYWTLFITVAVVAYVGIRAQVPPTGPIVQMNTPSTPTVQMFADGTILLPKLPAGTVLRSPFQDSNDAGMAFNLFAHAVCEVATPPAACATFKLQTPIK